MDLARAGGSRRVLSRDAAAALLIAHREHLIALVRRRLRSKLRAIQDAEDLVSSAFRRVDERISREANLLGTESDLMRFTWGVILNVLRERSRRAGSSPAVNDALGAAWVPDSRASAQGESADSEFVHDATRLISREVDFELLRWSCGSRTCLPPQLTHASATTVRQRLSRLRLMLRKRLGVRPPT